LKYDHFEVEVGADGFPVELGAGAMGITYRARDTVLNSVVALKVIDGSAAQDPRARSRFLREARAAAQIRHPNVARVRASRARLGCGGSVWCGAPGHQAIQYHARV